MRTLFVNPTKRRKRRSAPKRRRNGGTMVIRRNAGITPFVASENALIPNPRRRKRRSNPMGNYGNGVLMSGLAGMGGGAATAVLNTFALNRIGNPWARNGARFALGAGASFIPGRFGAATAGAMFSHMFEDLLTLVTGTAIVQGSQNAGTEADLDVLSADLEDLLRVP